MKRGFVDTNILIYAATGREDEPAKWEMAHELLREAVLWLSGQVLAEFYNIATVKHRLAIDQANSWLEYLEQFDCQPIDREIVLDGVAISQRYKISYWDGALIAATKRLHLDILYTEDLNHRQSYESVTVINPFLEN